MLRLAATAAVLALVPTAVFAQATPSSSSQLEASGLTPPTVLSQGYSPQGADVLVTQLLGQTVWTAVGDEGEEVGTINDMVVTSGVGLSAVVISVGGVLGVGAKDVAVAFDQLTWAEREDGSRRWVLATTPDALVDAPAFIWGDSEAVTGEPALSPEEEEAQLEEGDPNAASVDPELTTDQPEARATPGDREGLTAINATEFQPEQLRGIGVYGINDELIGSIGDVVLNPDGSVDAVIVDVGGFLGLGAKPVAVGSDNLTISEDIAGQRYLFISTTREQLEAQPAFDPTTYEAERNTQRLVVTP
ncbi:PRC-barrel domain-containing protein [Devosia albogilva]|uniref:PRC-barrel domain-containing protein n=1 Tax=Devosia albogilva TaxID=429726 RepID=A0ABW5QHQ9_9HYPH